jgi:hypothetical protein
MAQQQNLTRTLPLTVSNEVDIGSFAFSNGGGSLWISVTVPSSGYSVAKEYLLPIQYNQNINIWQTVLPASSTNSYYSNDFALEIKINGGTASLRLRTTASDGVNVGTAYISIKQDGVTSDTFTPSTATSAVSAPTTFFTSTALTQVGGNVGIGTTVPDSLTTVNANASGLQAPGANFAGTIFHLSGADNAKARLLFDAFGFGFMPQLTYRFARGTAAAPTAVQLGDALGQVTASGYRATGYTQGSRGTLTFLATENWNDTANGTAIAFATTANGTGSTVERMRIDHSGNVGIGTTAPIYPLDVQANSQWVARFKKTDATHGGIIVDASAGYNPNVALAVNGAIKWYMNSNSANGDTLQFWESAGSFPRFTLTQAGNLGIGTATPGYRLDVQGGSLNSSGGLCIAGDCKTAWSQVGGASSQWTTSGSNIYYNSGSVGIGTTSPSAGLDVQVPVTAVTAYGVRLQQTLTAGYNNAELNGLFINTSFVDGVDVGVRHNALVTGAGNIGIGSSVTAAGFDVQNVGSTVSGTTFGSRFQQVLPSAGNNATSTAVYINPNFSDGQAVGVRHNGLVVANGDVGIGTSTPASKLHVVGDGTITGNLTVTGNIAAKYQDVAEWVKSSQELSAGTVVVLDQTKSNQVIASSQAYDTRVAGVVSLQPGIALGENGAGKVLVATTGRVRIKVDASRGAIQVGDLLVTSDVEGVAMKSQPIEVGGALIHRPGTLVGKALEPLEKGTGEILVLLSLQ